MMPGITYLPCRSITCADAGAFSRAAGPTHWMRPLSRIMAAWATGAWPVPSIKVKFLSTLTSATREVANNSSRQLSRLFRIRPGIFENPLGARRIEDTAGAETREIGRCLLRSPAILLYEVDHFLGQRVADHPMSAHGGERRDLRVGNLFRFPFKAQGVTDTVPVDTGIVTATLRALDGGRYVDAHAKVFFFDALDELLRGSRVVEDRGASGWNGEAFDDGMKIRLHIPVPVRPGSKIFRGAQCAPVPGISQIYRLVLQGNFQEAMEFGQCVRIFVGLAGNGKDNVVVVEALGIAKPMKSIGHTLA